MFFKQSRQYVLHEWPARRRHQIRLTFLIKSMRRVVCSNYIDSVVKQSFPESIAVSGVCLTVIEFDATSFAADASTETLAA